MRAEQLADAIKSKFANARGQFPEFKVCCPLCSDKRFRLGINVKRQTAHCFNCGARLNALTLCEALGISATVWYEPNDFESFEAFLGENNHVAKTLDDLTSTGLELEADLMSDCVGSMDYEIAYNYLKNRGFDPDILMRDYSLLLPRPRAREHGRVILPVFEGGELVYFQARALSNEIYPKYLNPPKREGAEGKASFVFNLEQACLYDEILICEGIFSAIAAGPNAVAIFGKELSDAQTRKLFFAKIRKAVVVFDAGEQKSAKRAAAKLSSRMQVRIANLSHGDPNEISLRELQIAILNSEIFDSVEL